VPTGQDRALTISRVLFEVSEKSVARSTFISRSSSALPL
jgi:hypothetical protein